MTIVGTDAKIETVHKILSKLETELRATGVEIRAIVIDVKTDGVAVADFGGFQTVIGTTTPN